jgi:hypothetical protein
VSNASFVSATLDAEGRTLTLTLAGVADRTVVSVALLDLADAAGNALAGDVDVSARALFGDADGNGLVNDLDTAAIRRALGRPLTDLTAVLDLDLDGTIDATDLLHARRNSGGSVL